MKKYDNQERRFQLLQEVMSPLMDRDMMSSSLSERQEKNDVNYSNGRYLDAWARIFDIQDPCSAVTEIEGILYISFNQVEKRANESALKIIQVAFVMDVQAALCTVLLFNKAFVEAMKTTGLVNSTFKPIIGQLIQASKKSDIAIKETIENTTPNILKIQKEILNGKNTDQIKVLLRITQDVYKVYSKYNISEKVTLLMNPDHLHAELIIAEKLKDYIISNPDSGLNPYIGISKLSCHLCNEILNNLSIDHHGTHGTLYLNGFKLPKSLINEDYIEFIIKSVDKYRSDNWEQAGNCITENQRIATKKLSENAALSDDEDIEKEISIDDTTLWEFKETIKKKIILDNKDENNIDLKSLGNQSNTSMTVTVETDSVPENNITIMGDLLQEALQEVE